METISKIRLKYHRKGQSIREISRELRVSRNTVRKVLREERSKATYKQRVSEAPKLGAYKEELKSWLEQDKKLPKAQRASAIQVYARLQGLGYEGAYDSVQRYMKAFSERQVGLNHAYIPLSFAKGEAYQFDWSTEKVELNGVLTTIKVAHFRLCYSRISFMVAYLRESQEMLFDAHLKAFEFFGGVTLKGIYDNLKTAVDLIFTGKERQFNRRFLEMLNHYLIEPIACTPGAGWEKGQVEKQVQNNRQWLFVPRLKCADLVGLNQHLKQECVGLAQKRKHPELSGSIAEIFEQEKSYLKALPAAFDGGIDREVRVSSTCLVQIDRNRYSADCCYANSAATVRLYADKVLIMSAGEVIGEHARLFGRNDVSYEPWHYLPLLARKPGGLRNGAPFKNWSLPEGIALVLQHLMQNKGGDRECVKLLEAIPVHGLEEVKTACMLALEDKIIQADYILNLIGRLRPGTAGLSIDLPAEFALKEEPCIDTRRYDALLGGVV